MKFIIVHQHHNLSGIILLDFVNSKPNILVTVSKLAHFKV